MSGKRRVLFGVKPLAARRSGGSRTARASRRSRWLHDIAGSQMVELGFALPVLLVLLIGVIDFAKAYNINHVLTNAAREAAEMMAVSPLSTASPNCSSQWSYGAPGSGTPCSVQATAISVSNYLVNNGLSTASCLSSASATYSSLYTWTYSCSNVTLVINHANDFIDSNNNIVQSTQVTLSYPYTFSFGKVIGLLGASNRSPIGTQEMTASAVMQNTAQDGGL